MAKTANKKAAKPRKRTKARKRSLKSRLRAWLMRFCLGAVALVLVTVLVGSVYVPSYTPYMRSEARRLGGIDQTWVRIEEIAPVMARSAVAAEDVRFCNHWGFDVRAIREAIEAGGGRGASTITQQTVKNVYLWHGRSWSRKALEALLTPLVELFWSKERILEVYLNVAEFDEGVFGVGAAARGAFNTDADALSARQAARLAAILPAPKSRSARDPRPRTRQRAAAIMDGAAVIARDERSSCFAD